MTQSMVPYRDAQQGIFRSSNSANFSITALLAMNPFRPVPAGWELQINSIQAGFIWPNGTPASTPLDGWVMVAFYLMLSIGQFPPAYESGPLVEQGIYFYLNEQLTTLGGAFPGKVLYQKTYGAQQLTVAEKSVSVYTQRFDTFPQQPPIVVPGTAAVYPIIIMHEDVGAVQRTKSLPVTMRAEISGVQHKTT